jgi:hypothetical protein
LLGRPLDVALAYNHEMVKWTIVYTRRALGCT